MNCPKCGYTNAEGAECPRCGIVFSRYYSVKKNAESSNQSNAGVLQPRVSPVRRFYRVSRWIVLAGLILVLFLLLRTSQPPPIEIAPEAARRAEKKIAEFQASLDRGAPQVLAMDQSELNGWLHANLALKKSEGDGDTLSKAPETSPDPGVAAATDIQADAATLEQLQSSVRDVKIELLENALCIYAHFELHGMDLSLELEGQPMVRDGYLRLEPTRGKLGSLPLMAGTLKSATDRLFDSPQNREKFRLPPEIRDIRVEQGRLVVISR